MAKTDIIECTAQHDNETGEIIVSSSLSGPAPQTGEEKKPAPEAAKPSVKDQGSSKIMPEGPKLSVCPNCGAYLTKSDYHFCPKCGADLSAPLNPGCCTKCGARLPYRLSTYCPTCGKKLREEEAAVSGPSKSSGKDSDGTSPEEKIRMININYDNHVIGLSEVEISYILLWYENYCQEKQLEKTTCLPRDVFEEATIRKNYEQIMRIKADYALFKFRSHFVAYTRIDEVNDVINYWRDYFSTISVEKKLDEDLSNLGEIMSLANETIRNKENKAKKRRQNRIDFIIVLLTSVLSLFSITEGVFKLCERVESAVEYSENIAKIIIGFALWIGVVLFTVLKNKGTSKE